MADFDALLTKENILRNRLDRFIENGRKTAIAKRTQGFFEGKIADLQKLWDDYSAIDLSINEMQIQAKKTDKCDYVEEDHYGKAELRYSEYKGELIEGLRKLSTATAAGPINTTTIQAPAITLHQESSLPKITIPKYSGDYDMWRSFHDLFVSLIHNNTKLTAVQKLYHLKSSLTGEAEKLLRHTPITDADYEPAWNKLKERYHNKRILVNHQLKILVNQPKIVSEKSKEIKALIDTTSECLQQLKSLEVDTSSWDVLLVHILIQKLPYLTLRLWEEDQGSTEDLPKYSEFQEFLQKRLKILEAIADAVTSGSSKVKPITRGTTYTHLSTENNRCPACDGKHYILNCKKYNQLKVKDRWKIIKTSGRCLNCFSRKHVVKDCTNNHRCFKCKQKHHTTLHEDSNNTFEQKQSSCSKPKHNTKLHEESNNTFVQKQSSCNVIPRNTTNNMLDARETNECNEDKSNNASSTMAKNADELGTTQAFMTGKTHQTLLSTVLVIAQSESGEQSKLRCLLDTGSQSSFITEDACKKLNASCIKTSTAITGLNTSQAAFASRKTTLKLRSCGSNKTVLEEDFFIIKQITEALPTRTVAKADYKHLRGLDLADPKFWKPGKIDALLGVQTFAKIIQEGVRKGHATAPVALKTIFGWVLLGSTSKRHTKDTTALTITTCDTRLEDQLKKFWEIEEVAAIPMFTEKEKECQRMYNLTTHRLANGKYQVKLPFANNKGPNLGQSRPQAIKRYTQLQRQLEANPSLKKDYNKCLDEYWELGHMEMINPPHDGELCYYVPHHAVLKESTTTKLRVVFDASAKTTNGYSLNEQLLTGPTIQPKLYSTLLNWRKYKVALNADIEKMYRMIEVHPDHRTFQRIIWQHPITKQMQDFQLSTVTFGTSSAPYLAIRTLQQLADDEQHNWSRASIVVKNDFYVDDVLTGADNITEAKVLQHELISLLKSGGFHLRKWASNEPTLVENLPIEFREPRSDKFFSEDESMKALGVRWHPALDHFSFKYNATNAKFPATKRIMLSEIATLYDPLGWLAPVLIKGKILMQTLWIMGSSWDNIVPESIQEQWDEFKKDLYNIQQIAIPRWINYTSNTNTQIHGFCDASEKAYAAAIYMRVTSPNGKTTCHLLTAKTRVAPTKPTTIPRLELNGAVLLARVMKTTIRDMKLDNIPMYAWTDSTIVLQWIREHPSRWKTYVANRIVEIQDIIRYDNWRHVPTKSNPADLASRGISALQLINEKLWWHGPEWMTQEATSWPKLQTNLGRTKHEEKQSKSANFVCTTNDDFLYKYSSYTKLIRIIAFMRRFINNCQHPTNKNQKQLSCNELQSAEDIIIKIVQKRTFAQEYHCLVNNKPLPKTSKLLTLNPFIDTQGLIRLGGRLENAPIPYNRKHPIILPHDHQVTCVLIDKFHIDTLHGGTSLVLNAIRNKYWVLNSRRTIASRIHKCVKCARQRSELHTQLMGNLPTSRVKTNKPFTKVGVDYAGPITIRASKLRNAKHQKAYICIFICMTTKAIHIELVSDLTAEAFVAALKRFIARRGMCSDIYSDCGTNFVGANKSLQSDYHKALKLQQTNGIEFCTTKGITWHFNPPSTPHFGGLWEAGVKSVKYHLRRVLGNAICTFEEYATILTQIEACLNSRPLCYMPNSADDMFVLTPGHFLIGQPLNSIPEPESVPTNLSPSQRWKHVQQLVRQIWDKWSKDYLNQLQNRPKWQMKQQNLQPGEIVIIKTEQIQPTFWPLGIIEKVFPGKDGLVRVVQVRTKNGSYQRPIAKLCRLPVEQ